MRRLAQILKTNPAVFVLLGTYVYLFFGILTYENAWVEPEMLQIESQYLAKKIPVFSADWWREGFDYPLFEYSPRLYRPLSSYFQMVDAELRSTLWSYVLPHPSLSLTWLFTLLLSPWLLFQLLRRLGVEANCALLACSLYLANPGVLSVTTMYFRPAKAMTNFALLLCLYIAAQIASHRSPREFLHYLALLLLMLFSFFWDETGVLLYPAIAVFFPALVWRSRNYWLAYLGLGFSAVVVYIFALPSLTEYLGFPYSYDKMKDYVATKNTFDVQAAIQQHLSFIPEALTNLKIAFMDCFGLTNISYPPSTSGIVLQGMTYMAVAALLIFVAVRTWQAPNFKSLTSRAAGFIIFLSLFDTYLISSIGNNTWGLYYYGVYISVFFAILIGLILNSLHQRVAVTVMSTLTIASSFYIFPATNYVYKAAHYYEQSGNPVPWLKAMFTNSYNRFDLAHQLVLPDLHAMTARYWDCARNNRVCKVEIARELKYLEVEMRHD